MLFVSRYLTDETFGIVDTDDNVEEVVHIASIGDIVATGVTVHGIDEFSVLDDRVNIYQPAETLSQLQVKMKVLKHIDIKVWDGIVTSIQWVPKDISEPVTIRVSDFGHACANYMIARNYMSVKHDITLVLDDSLEYGFKTFRRMYNFQAAIGIHNLGVVFDIREVGDEKAESLYDQFYRESSTGQLENVIDNKDRKGEMLSKRYNSLIRGDVSRSVW